ncbi:hypothetical protein [Cohnella cellulosilytica]|uniref:Uncharacterized protein n=1 Tax=Cohnella cellulosilytica TaxID=986710 RepID=A0ABW2F904_9BACL
MDGAGLFAQNSFGIPLNKIRRVRPKKPSRAWTAFWGRDAVISRLGWGECVILMNMPHFVIIITISLIKWPYNKDMKDRPANEDGDPDVRQAISHIGE